MSSSIHQVDLGVQGAKRTRYYANSPDALLRKLVEKNIDATETELEEQFEELVLKKGGSVLAAIISYWFANRYRALIREITPPEIKRKEQASKKARARADIEAVKKATVGAITRRLLTATAPACGKKVAQMTKEDCEREGGWFRRLAKKLNQGQSVQEAELSDADLWELYNKG